MTIQHVVQPGEGLSSIAERYGFLPATLWNHPANEELRTLRRNGNVLAPGDVLVIPDKQPKTVQVATGATHTFRRKAVPAKLRVKVMRNGRPRAREPFQLEVDDRLTLTGTTSPEGFVEALVPPGARTGRLYVGKDAQPLALSFGTLDPADSLSGIQKRLRNLGLYEGAVDGQPHPELAPALRKFQQQQGLPVTGEADAVTHQRLRDLHAPAARGGSR
jgi:LysM repeat protein